MKMFASLLTFGADDPRIRARRAWASFAAFTMALLIGAGAPVFSMVLVVLLVATGLRYRNMSLRDGMKPVMVGAFLLGVMLYGGTRVYAQGGAVANFYSAGVSAAPGQTPSVAATAMYDRKMNDSGLSAFTLIDVLPTTTKPLTVVTNVAAGVAQKVLTIGNTDIFVPTSAGISWSGSNTGWAWSTGAAAAIPVKPGWYLVPTVRVSKSSVSGATGYQPIFGVMVGWGS